MSVDCSRWCEGWLFEEIKLQYRLDNHRTVLKIAAITKVP